MSEDAKVALRKVMEAGYQLTPEGFEYLKTLGQESLDDLVVRAIKKANSSSDVVPVIDIDMLRSVVEEGSRVTEPQRPLTGKSRERPLASEYAPQIDVLDDASAESIGTVGGFIEHFRSRYRKIEGILRERMDVRDAMPIGRALGMPVKSKVKVIGIVTRKRAKGERLFIDIEDMEDAITLMASDEETVRKGLTLLEDQVICAEATKFKQDLFIANDFIWPDVPSRAPKRSEVPLCCAFLADMHVGSKLFMGELFERFIRWMNLEVGPPESRRLASRVKYVVIDGDIVDGIGIYPDQYNELAITSIRDQYVSAYAFLSKLPDYVEVIILPGNHDAVRKSLPQPPISRDYAESLYGDERFRMLGNPSRLMINGVESLIYHGKSLDDVLSQTPGLGYSTPAKGIELLLRCRHVAPAYGATTPIAPGKEDRLVVTSVPDILQMGHIHVYESRRYKGVTIIASAPWQEQTSYQRRMDLKPTPGIASIVDLQTHQLISVDFNKLVG